MKKKREVTKLKGKNKKGTIIIAVWFLLLVAIIGCGGSRAYTATSYSVTNAVSSDANSDLQGEVETEEKTKKVEKDGLSMKVTYGFNYFAKYGRYMNVTAEITNHGENFNGFFRVIVPSSSYDDNSNIMYEKPAVIASGETKQISLPVEVLGNASSQPTALLLDEKEKVILEKSSRITLYSDSSVLYIGALTDDFNSLNYFNQTGKTKLFQLSADTFPDQAQGLDCLDIIVINDYNTSQLNEAQYTALKQWVKKGGSLVLGTGSTYQKTLEVFKDDFFTGEIGKLTKVSTTFGLSKEDVELLKREKILEEEAKLQQKEELEQTNEERIKEGIEPIEDDILLFEPTSEEALNDISLNMVTKDALSITPSDSTILLREENVPLVLLTQKGSGNIQVMTIDIGLTYDNWYSIGTRIYELVQTNLSSSKKQQIEKELDQGSYYGYSVIDTLNYNDAKELPKVSLFTVIIGIYLLVVGPFLYLILKKIDKRHLTWMIVPACSVLFALILYAAGSSTRVTEPFVNYLAYLRFDENKKASEEVYFSLTAPYNKKYEVEISDTNTVRPFSQNNYYWRYNTTDQDNNKINYKTGIKYGTGTITLEMNDYSSFSSAYFVSEQEVKSEGTYESDLSYYEGAYEGFFENQLGYDIENAFLLGNASLVPLGDIKQGERRTIQKKDKTILMSTREHIYQDNTISKIVSGEDSIDLYSNKTPSIIKKKYSALQNFIGSTIFTNMESNVLLVGFTSEEKGQQLIQDIELKSNGLSMVIISLPINYTKDNKTWMTSIDQYGVVAEGGIDQGSRSIYSEPLRIEYQFPTEETIDRLIYSKQYNSEFDSNYWSGFYGSILAFNYNTDQYEEIFKSGVEGEVTDFSNYLDDNNKMILQYEIDPARQGESSVPILSIIKEEN